MPNDPQKREMQKLDDRLNHFKNRARRIDGLPCG